MKKILIASLLVGSLVNSVGAQSVEDIKQEALIAQQFGGKNSLEIKGKIDKAMLKEKFTAKPEAYILKASIYAGLSQDSTLKDQSIANRTEAYSAYRQYLAKDAKKEFIKDPVYSRIPLVIYYSFLNEGIEEFNKSDWEKSANILDSTVILRDFILNNSIDKIEYDTTCIVLAGNANQNAKRDEMATKYYKRLADMKVAGKSYLSNYQYLVVNSFNQNNTAEFNKYKALGAELYPEEEFFKFTEDEFIWDMKDEVEREKRVNEKMASNPNDVSFLSTYGLLLFNKLNNDSSSMLPDYNGIEEKMISAITKSSEADSKTAAKGYFYLGSHFINKTIRINQQLDSTRNLIREYNKTAKPDKTGKIPVPKELNAKRQELSRAYDDETDKALPYLLKSAEAYGKQTNSGIEKQNYKKLVDQLIIIYGEKKGAAMQTADKAKFAAEEKRFTDLYSNIK